MIRLDAQSVLLKYSGYSSRNRPLPEDKEAAVIEIANCLIRDLPTQINAVVEIAKRYHYALVVYDSSSNPHAAIMLGAIQNGTAMLLNKHRLALCEEHHSNDEGKYTAIVASIPIDCVPEVASVKDKPLTINLASFFDLSRQLAWATHRQFDYDLSRLGSKIMYL